MPIDEDALHRKIILRLVPLLILCFFLRLLIA